MEKINKLDINAAFKALDEIEIPEISTTLTTSERMALNEVFRPTNKTDSLLEDYYDINSKEELEDASKDRAEEVAQAKLAKIEKIVDLDAETPEDLQPSYVGKTIIQCPQCMTLFYKNPEDIVPSEDNQNIVNVNEPCQHCGNINGYDVIGKVDAVSVEDEHTDVQPEAEENELNIDFDIQPEEENNRLPEPEEEATELDIKPVEETTVESGAEEIKAEEENPEDEEEKKEESFEQHSENILAEQVENALKEDINADELAKKLKEHDEYIKVLQDEIKAEEEAVKSAKNDFIKKMHENNLASLKDALDKAVPEEVKAEAAIEELPTAEDAAEDMTKNEALKEEDEKFPDPEKHEEVGEVDGIKIYHCKNCGKFGAKINDKVIKKDSKEEIEACLKGECKESVCSEGEKKLCEDKENFTLVQNAIPCEQEIKGADCAKDICKDQPLVAHDEDTVKDLKKLNEADHIMTKAEFEVAADKAGIEKPVHEEICDKCGKDVEDAYETDKEAYHCKNNIDDAIKEDVSIPEAEINKMLDSKEFQTPVSEAEVETLLAEESVKGACNKKVFEAIEEIKDEAIENCITESLTNVYENVDSFKLTDCELNEEKLTISGNINFKSGNITPTTYVFTEAEVNKNNFKLTGINESLAKDGTFILEGCLEDNGTLLLAESLTYNYHIGESLVEGLAKRN